MTNPFALQALLPRTGAKGALPTTREAYRQVMDIALPSVLEMVLMSMIGSVDTMMVGTLGHEAIAAVGLVGQPRMLMLSIFFALNIGVTAIVARRKGEGLAPEANRTLRVALVMVMIGSIAMTVVALAFARPLMEIAGAKSDTIEDATTYFRILMGFLPINALTLCICAAQRGVGNTRITMYVNVVSNLVNVVLNYLLIGGNLGFPRLEVAGAAWATVAGLTVGFVLSLVTVTGHGRRGNAGFLHLSLHDDWRPDRATVKGISVVGGSAMVEQVALRIGFFVYARIVAELGTMAFAAHQVCMQFLNLSFTFGDGIGIAGTSLVGQMLGKERPDLANVYAKAAQRIALVVSVLLAASIAVFRFPLVSLFTDQPQVLALAAQVMFMVALFQPFQTTSVVISGALRGAGDNLYVAMVMLACVSVIRPVCAVAAIWLLTGPIGRPDIALMGAWGASLVDMMLRMTLVYRRFNGGKWHDIKV